jgi:hypothetical protein
MLLPIVMSLALSSTTDLEALRGFCAFPTTPTGGPMLQLSLEPGADRDRPRSRQVWLELGAHRIRGRMIATTGAPEAPGLVILSEELAGELTISLRADGRASLIILPEGASDPIERSGRCGGVSSLLAALAR